MQFHLKAQIPMFQMNQQLHISCTIIYFIHKHDHFATHGDIRRVHRTSTKTTQDAIQRARAHVEMC